MSRSPEAAPERQRRLLVVADDTELLVGSERLLQKVVQATFVRSIGAAREVLFGGLPDLVLIDFRLPDGDGLELIAELTAEHPCLPVVVLTGVTSTAQILAATRAGALGYLLKTEIARELLPAIEDVLAGGAPMSRSIARTVLAQLRVFCSDAGRTANAGHVLTPREAELLQLFSEGATYQQAGVALCISPNTVRAHVRSLYEKLTVGTKTGAVLAGLRLGIVVAS